jgi:tetratricopeptide (TPR) repeat protein
MLSMRTMVLLLILVLATPMACAMSYPGHDPQKILTVSENASGQKTYGLDIRYLDHMLGDLSRHAGRYPPSFDSKDQKQRAIQDLVALSGMLRLLLNDSKSNTQIVLRSAIANRMGRNLDIPGAAEKAEQQFQALLQVEPEAPQGNYQFGIFLAETGRVELSIPYLEKALALGLGEANYSLGMAYLGLGNKAEALVRLRAYL